MKRKKIKTVLLITAAMFSIALVTLGWHIYAVSRPMPPGANTRVMARVDFEDDINAEDAAVITGWFYKQEGVEHVLCNDGTDILVFSFRPVKTSADEVIARFKEQFDYKASRYMPSKEEMASGCPVSAKGITSRFSAVFQ